MRASAGSGEARPVRRATGTGARRAVCVSGLGGATEEWASVRPALARHGDVIAVELTLRATGRPLGRGGPLQAGLEALDEVVGSAPERPVLLGHSMGAVVGMLMAATQPHRPAGLVLTAPFLPVARNGRSRLATAADYARHRVLFVADARARRRRHAGNRAVDPRARAAGLWALAHYGLRSESFHAIADRVTCPVLLVHGSEDHYVPPAFARAAAGRHPAWQLALITGAGHFPHRDNPDAWLTAVDPWLQRLQRDDQTPPEPLTR